MSVNSSEMPLSFSPELLLGLVASLLLSGVAAGCGSSEPTSSQSSGQTDAQVYARGFVMYADSTAVEGAVVTTERPGPARVTDSTGFFRFYQPLPDAKEYTFVVNDPNREGEVNGRVTGIPGVAGVVEQDTIPIIIGRDVSLEALSLDSLQQIPGGPGLKRTGVQ